MPETMHRAATPSDSPDQGSSAHESTTEPTVREAVEAGSRPIRSRIGNQLGGGFYPAHHRYRLFLSAGCPLSLRVAITRSLLYLEDWIPVTWLSLGYDEAADASPLRSAYEATSHGYEGPLNVPALCDQWSGRVVSNHGPGILRDLATRFAFAGEGTCPTTVHPDIHDTDIRVAELLDKDITEAAQRAAQGSGQEVHGEARQTLLAALADLERRLETMPYLLGDTLTAADVHACVTLVYLDVIHRPHLDADSAHRVGAHPRLWSYCRQLLRHPAVRRNLRLEAMVERHRQICRFPEASCTTAPRVTWAV